MNSRVLIPISVGLNVVFAAALLSRRDAESGRTASEVERATRLQRTLITNPPRVQLIAQKIPFRWSEIESTDFREYIERLRAVGCPEQTVRDIIVAEVMQLFEQRRRAVVPEDIEWWRSDARQGAAHSLLRKQQDVDQERDALLTELLGDSWRAARAADSSTSASQFVGPVLGALSPERRAELDALLARRGEEMKAAREAAPGAYSDLDAERERQKTREELAKLLTPQQLEEYLLRWSASSERLREDIAGLNLTPDQFREIFRKIDAAEQRALGEGTASAEPDLNAVRAGAMEEALGAGPYRELKLRQDPVFSGISSSAEKAGLPPELVIPMYEVTVASRAEQQRIRTDTNLTEAQRDEALLQAELETMRALRQIAGEERWPAMRDGDRFIGN